MAKKKTPKTKSKSIFSPGAVRAKPFKKVKTYQNRYTNKRIGADEMLYEQWRQAVLERDGHCCQFNDCKSRLRLECHHVREWALHPMLRWEVSNGITLCRKHHRYIRNKESRYVLVFMERIAKNRWKGRL